MRGKWAARVRSVSICIPIKCLRDTNYLTFRMLETELVHRFFMMSVGERGRGRVKGRY